MVRLSVVTAMIVVIVAQPVFCAEQEKLVDVTAIDVKLPDGWVDGFEGSSRAYFKKVKGEYRSLRNMVKLTPLTAKALDPKEGFAADPEVLADAVKNNRKGYLSGEIETLGDADNFDNGWVVPTTAREYKDAKDIKPGFVMRLNLEAGPVLVQGCGFEDESSRNEGIEIAKTLSIPEGVLDLAAWETPIPAGWEKGRVRSSSRQFLKAVGDKKCSVDIERFPRSAAKDVETYAKMSMEDALTPEIGALYGGTPSFIEVTEKKDIPGGWYCVGKTEKKDPKQLRVVACVTVNEAKLRVNVYGATPEILPELVELIKGLK